MDFESLISNVCDAIIDWENPFDLITIHIAIPDLPYHYKIYRSSDLPSGTKFSH